MEEKLHSELWLLAEIKGLRNHGRSQGLLKQPFSSHCKFKQTQTNEEVSITFHKEAYATFILSVNSNECKINFNILEKEIHKNKYSQPWIPNC